MRRPTLTRIKYGFAWVYKPVLDDGPSRAFDTMAEYRRWCHEHLPPYLGYRLMPANHEEFRGEYERLHAPRLLTAAQKAMQRAKRR